MHRNGLELRVWRTAVLVLMGALALAAALPSRAADLSKLDLSGDWYVLIVYKDSRSEDKTLVHIKDMAWSVQQEPAKMTVAEYPYVVFDEGSEELRKAAMRGHKTWEPEGLVLDTLREHVDVSERAKRSKTLTGDMASGMKSGEGPKATGKTVDFSRNWDVTWAPAKVQIQIVDSMGGSSMLGEMEEASVYLITDQPSPGELTGTWSEGEKSGSLRMIRAKEHRVVK
jgi:hypothetical protein